MLLEQGAARVYALDVGHGQMNADLARDPRVHLREGVNARDLAASDLPEPVTALTADVSFISLKLALPPALALTARGAWAVVLVKPQFEVGQGRNRQGRNRARCAGARARAGRHRGFHRRDAGLAGAGDDGKPNAGRRRQYRISAGGVESMTICRHFGVCGGCTLQDMPPDAYRRHKQALVEKALARAGLDQVRVSEPIVSPEKSRRRAMFKFGKEKGHVVVGFHAARSHAIVDMQECLVLTKALRDFTETLRQGLAPVLAEGEKAEIHVSETEIGLDLAFRWPRKLKPSLDCGHRKGLRRRRHRPGHFQWRDVAGANQTGNRF